MTDGPAPATAQNRARGIIRARFASHGGVTRAVNLHEAGGYRMRFPRVDRRGGQGCEAVCINTGGGMVGGDVAGFDMSCGPGATVAVTTQSAEKMYRCTDTPTAVRVRLSVAANGRLDWLPQETILFDRVRLARTLDADVAAGSALLAAETLVFGRLAMGEVVQEGSVRDRWRVRRDGRLIFAEDLRLEGAVQDLLDRSAIGSGARAFTTLLYVAADAEARLEPLRERLRNSDAAVSWGASAWNGFLTLRGAAASPDMLRRIILDTLELLRGRSAPRVWQ